MTIRDAINAQLKQAMKSGDKRKVSTLRLMNSAIKEKDIAGRTEGHASAVTPDAGLTELFAKMVKQRQESVAIYEQGGRPELAQGEREEIEIIQTFMPKQLSEEEARAAISGAIEKVGAAGIKDMGKVMAELKARHAGQLDMAKAGALVKTMLG
jgi:uncharacterized protein YqeY